MADNFIVRGRGEDTSRKLPSISYSTLASYLDGIAKQKVVHMPSAWAIIRSTFDLSVEDAKAANKRWLKENGYKETTAE